MAFTRVFARSEQDAGLAGRIIAGELGGVARWALEGAADVLRSGGYAVPASVLAAREEWQRNADTVRLFAEARLSKTQTPAAGSQLVYDDYVRWTQRNGHKPMASNKFVERLELAGFTRHRLKTGMHWDAELVMGESA